MLHHHLVKFVLIYLVPYLAHSRYNVFLGDVPRPVRVELVEYCLQFIIVQKLLNVKCGHQELRVVYFLIAEEVHLIYDLINLLIS